MNEPRVRSAVPGDARDIASIYNHYVRSSVCTFQVEEDSVEARTTWLSGHTERFPAVVAERDGELVGWGSLTPYNPRTLYTAWDSIYVRQDLVGRGIGSAMLKEMIGRARKQGLHSLLAGVNSGQDRSYALHLKFGFEEIGVVKEASFKLGRWVDQRILQLML
jgi:phosphinothricin acetyltransferase